MDDRPLTWFKLAELIKGMTQEERDEFEPIFERILKEEIDREIIAAIKEELDE